MSYYRKKPIVIEARRFTNRDHEGLAKWCGGLLESTDDAGNWILGIGGAWPYRILIHTPEGDMQADFGDWIIKGVKGEFYPCKADIFEQTYEALDKEEDKARRRKVEADLIATITERAWTEEDEKKWQQALDQAETDLITSIRENKALFGAVCSMFELCDHDLCRASYGAFEEMEKAEMRHRQQAANEVTKIALEAGLDD